MEAGGAGCVCPGAHRRRSAPSGGRGEHGSRTSETCWERSSWSQKKGKVFSAKEEPFALGIPGEEHGQKKWGNLGVGEKSWGDVPQFGR